MAIDELEILYLDAAVHLRVQQLNLVNFSEALDEFILAKEKIQSHSKFTGYLPKTFFSGGDLDPTGSCPMQ